MNKKLQSIVTNNASYYAKKTWEQYIVCNRQYLTEAFSKVLSNPDHYMLAHILKSDASNTTTISLTNVDNRDIVIKRYNIKNSKHAVKRAVQPSRAFRCWVYAHQLLWFDIATPKPIAMIEKRFGPLRRQAYFIYEYIPGPQGFDVFRDNPANASITQIRAEKTVTLIKKLLDNNFSHGDLKASNIINDGKDPYFIDLDAMRKHRIKYIDKKRRIKEIKRFLENWSDAKTYLLFAGLLRGS